MSKPNLLQVVSRINLSRLLKFNYREPFLIILIIASWVGYLFILI